MQRHKVLYAQVENYLPRKVVEAEVLRSRGSFFLKEQRSKDIIDVVKDDNRIVILGDAGVGKTTELRRIASQFSGNDSSFYPFLIPLNRYVNQDLSELLPEYWREIPEHNLLVILDGLDEIESKNQNDAIRQIELFSDKRPSSHIIVSCRTNFYELPSEHFSGTLQGFSPYVLLDPDEKEIKSYVEAKLK